MNSSEVIWNLIQMLLAEKENSRRDENTKEENDNCKKLHNH